MRYTIPLLIWLCTIVTLPLGAQNRFTGHFLPRILYNSDFTDRLHWTVSVEPDLIWLRKSEGRAAEAGVSPFILNGEIGIDYQLTNDLNIASGYLLGWRNLDTENTDLEHRFLQQLSLTQRLNKYRLRWRVRSEQRFFRQRDYQVVHRLRSRLGVDFPLNGDQLDPGEPYLHATSEYLVNPEIAQPLFLAEMRLYTGLGWRLRSGLRLENGLEWRSRRNNSLGERRRALLWRLTLTI